VQTPNGASGTTALQAIDPSAAAETLLGADYRMNPNSLPSVIVTSFSDCVLGDGIAINITGAEGDLGSGTGLRVLQAVVIDFTTPAPAQKRLFLAWARQRNSLQHGCRDLARDVNEPATGATHPTPLGGCFGASDAGGDFQVRYIK